MATSSADGAPARSGVRRLQPSRTIRYVPQMRADDCGACALAMVLEAFGKVVRVDELREALAEQSLGTNARSICRVARRFGLRARGLRVEEEELPHLPPASILHWEFNHFVVFARWGRKTVEIVDPAVGPRKVPIEQFRRSFTGVVMVFEPADDFVPGGSRRRMMGRYLSQLVGAPWPLVRVLLMSLLVQVLALPLPVLTGVLVDRVLPRNDHRLLLACAAAAVPLLMFHALTTFVRAHLLVELRANLDTRISANFFEHLLGLPFSFFQKRAPGDLLQRLNSNTLVREALTSGVMSGVLDALFVSINLAALVVISPVMAGLAVVLALLQVGVYVLARHRIREIAANNLQAEAKMSIYQTEVVNAMESIKASGAERPLFDRWSELFVDVLNGSVARGRMNAVLETLSSALRIGSPLVVLLVGSYLVMDGQLRIGTMLSLTAFTAGFLVPVAGLVSTATNLQMIGTYIERSLDVLETPLEQTGVRRTAVDLPGEVSLERVSFRYAPEAPLVIREVTFRLREGEFVAIVGRSGSGKSTLARLIMGLYQPTSGQLLFGGVDMSTLDLESVRSRVGVVTQMAPLFGTSVRNNIALLDTSADLDAVIRAAKLAQIHDEILALPMGYETPLVGGGSALSGGQRQRIALARALVRTPAILVLDEATSAVDSLTEGRIQQAIDALDCTRLVIAHRLTTVRNADRILVLDGGQIVEQGNYAELVAMGGKFAALVAGGGDDPGHRRSVERGALAGKPDLVTT